MRSRVLAFLAFSVPLWAANFKLYMKDGGFQLVREYTVESDRVRFYSTDRSDWEEIPLALIDLKRTEAEAGARKATLEKEAKELSDEEAAAREARAEIRKIPQDPGLYRLENGQLRIFKDIDTVVHNAKGRNILSKMAPLPIIPGKATLEIEGEHSTSVVNEDRPEFFLQLAQFNTFAIVKATPAKGVRVVERITIVPVSKELMEERDTIPIFQKQLSENGLYKIWPQDPLPKGDYVVMEYTEGKMDQRVWDFKIE